METKKLNIGDVIYNDSRWSGLQKYVIDKVTKTTASSGTLKFKREYSDWLTTIPKQRPFSGNHFVVATKELDDRAEKIRHLYWIKKEIDKATLFQLRQIREILER